VAQIIQRVGQSRGKNRFISAEMSYIRAKFRSSPLLTLHCQYVCLGRVTTVNAAMRDGGRPWVILGLGLLLAAGLNLASGSLAVSPTQMLAILCEGLGWKVSFGTHDSGQYAVFWSLRVPRVILAIGCGVGLAMAGAAIQGIFRNPLADPALIGVTSGGAVGAIGGILLGTWIVGLPLWLARSAVPLGALGGAMLATLLIYRLATVAGRTSSSTLLLVGIAINALAGAVIGFVLFYANAEDLRSFLFWTLGSLDRASWAEVRIGLLIIIPAALTLPFFAGPLNLLLLGETEAFHLGVSVQKLTRQVVFLSAGLAGTTVALAGTIGFVGLMVPHLMRLWLGPDHRRLFPASAIAGAILLLVADAAARSLMPPAVLPIGILTALAGAPFFLFLLARRKGALDG
jgi:iron complex transport system permease protein